MSYTVHCAKETTKYLKLTSVEKRRLADNVVQAVSDLPLQWGRLRKVAIEGRTRMVATLTFRGTAVELIVTDIYLSDTLELMQWGSQHDSLVY